MAVMKTSYTTKSGKDDTELFFKRGKLVAIAEKTRYGYKLLSFPSLRLIGTFENLYNVIPHIERQQNQESIEA